MAIHGWKWLETAGIAGNIWNLPKRRLEMAGMVLNDWNFAGNGWIWLIMAEMDGD